MSTQPTLAELTQQADSAVRVSDVKQLESIANSAALFAEPDARLLEDQVRMVIAAIEGEFPVALELGTKVLHRQEDRGDADGIARAKGNLANVYRELGIYPEAVALSEEVLEHFALAGNLYSLALSHRNLASLYHDVQEFEDSRRHHQKAFDYYAQIPDQAGMASSAGNLGVVLGDSGDAEASLEHFTRALSIDAQTADHHQSAWIRNNLVSTLLHYERWDDARTHLALIDESSLRDVVQVTRHRQNIAHLAMHDGDHDAAHASLMGALQIAEEHKIEGRRGDLHRHLRDLARERNDFDGYVNHNQVYTEITEAIRGQSAIRQMVAQRAAKEIDAMGKERDRERAILYSTLPKDVADRVLRGEDVSGDQHDEVSVLFLDVVQFTSHTDHLAPEIVVQMLDSMFSSFDAIANAERVVKIKTIGDSYMAVAFHDPDDHHHTVRMIRVATQMMQTRLFWPGSEEVVQFRIGLHHGPVVAGVIGTERLQYDVWGDTVNVASRMESHSEPGKIHASDGFAMIADTHLKADAPDLLVNLVPRGIIDVKGKGALETHWVEPTSGR